MTATYRVEVLATGEVRDLCDTAEAAKWIAYAKRSVGYSVGQNAKQNWAAQLDRMESGDEMGYAVPAAGGGIEDFARVTVL